MGTLYITDEDGSTLVLAAGGDGPQGATGPGYKATSATSLALASSGSKAFTVVTGLAYSAGARVRATSASDTTKWMEGVVSSYSGTTLTVTMDAKLGTGTFADWNLNLAGEPGSGGGGGATPPSGTGLVHATGGSFVDPATLLVNVDVDPAAAIAWSKISKAGAAPGDVGAAATSHAHAESDVTGLVADLAGKASTTHASTHAAAGSDPLTISESQVTGLTSDLAAKEATANKGAASGYASLDGSTKVPIAQLPTGSSSTTVAIGNDARLSDARTPTAHAASHNAGGGDALAIDAAAGTGSLRTLGTGATAACAGNDGRLSDARTPTAHTSSHKHGGGDEVATATPAANAIPKAGAGGTLAVGWVPALVGDSGSGGTAGLVPAPAAGDASKFLKGNGTWASVPGGGDALVANPLSQFAATTSAQLAGVLTDEEGSGGGFVRATSPNLTTPNIGVATATSVNKVAITAPATSATLTIADGATLTVPVSASVSGANTGDQTDASTLTAGTLPAGRLPAHTGDVTSSAGSAALTLANIPSATSMAGSLLATAIAAPGTPAAGKGLVYVDSTSKNVAVKDDAGVVKHGVKTKAAVSNSFVTAIDDDGTVTVAQPSISSLSDASSVVTPSSTNTLTNKRFNPRTGTTTSSATPTINTDNVDFYSLTAQAADITSFTTNLSGTPVDGQTLWIAITGTAARAITWGSSFESSTVTLPSTTVSTNRLDVGLVWNAATSKWRCVASA